VLCAGRIHYQAVKCQSTTALNFCFLGSGDFCVTERDGLEGSFGIFGLWVCLERMPNVPYSSRDGARWEILVFYKKEISFVEI